MHQHLAPSALRFLVLTLLAAVLIGGVLALPTLARVPEVLYACDPPGITCGEDIVVSADADCGAVVTWPDPQMTGSEPLEWSCDPPSGSLFPLGETTVVCTVSNECGSDSCSFTVTVVDDTPPTISCPPTLSYDCLGDAPAPYTSLAALEAAGGSAADNCGIAPASFALASETYTGDACDRLIRRTYQIADDAGNTAACTQEITVLDSTAPILMGVPADVTVECDAVPTPASVTATDNCDADPEVTYSETRTNGSCANSYTLTRSWMATDDCGNTKSASQTITVADTIAPVLTGVPDDTTAECDTVPAPANVTATDNGDASVEVAFSETRTAGTCANGYMLTRTWTATDDCGNSTRESQVITVVDTTAPALVGVPANVTLECGDGLPEPANVTATDNCNAAPTMSYRETRLEGACDGTFSLKRTWTATDACGNSTSKSQLITVADTVAPVITRCAPDQIVCVRPDGMAVIPDVMDQVSAADTCRSAHLTAWQEPAPYTVVGPGVHTIVVTITDDCGNATSCDIRFEAVSGSVVAYKFDDVDRDGVPDPQEAFLAGWEITLYDAQGGVVDAGLTDENGQITFSNLPCGSYTVKETPQDGWINSTPTEVVVQVEPGSSPEVYLGSCFLWNGGEILGFTFWDGNGNGFWIDPETTIPGVTIRIRNEGGEIVYETETIYLPGSPMHGGWRVTEPLQPGIYIIEQVLPGGWVQTYPYTEVKGDDDSRYTVRLNADGSYDVLSPDVEQLTWFDGLNFGNCRPMGYKFYDGNRDGVRQGDEPLISGWQIVLNSLDGTEVYRTATLGGSDWRTGRWFLTRPLPDGDYYVAEVPQAGWLPSYPATPDARFKIHLDDRGSYGLMEPIPPWFNGLNFGNYPEELQPPTCPDCPDWLVFQSNREEDNWNILRMRLDGTEVEQLTYDLHDDEWPVMSLSGERVAFATDRDGNWEIYRMNADGTGEVNVTRYPQAQDKAPSWSCSWIAFQSDREGNWEIFKTDPDGLYQVRLTNSPAADEAPSWSPDGRWIAFQSNRDGNWELYIMDDEGSNLRRLTDNPAIDRNPTWSPDGQWIAFESDRDGQFDIYKVNLTTGAAVRLTDDPNLDAHPEWMPYCDYIFWQTDRHGDWEVYRMAANGSDQMNLTYTPLFTDTLGSIQMPDPEPITGTVTGLVFEDLNGDGVRDENEPGIADVSVVITDAEGASQVVVTDDNGEYRAEVLVGVVTVDVDEGTLPANYIQTAGMDPSSVQVLAGQTADAGADGYQYQQPQVLLWLPLIL